MNVTSDRSIFGRHELDEVFEGAGIMVHDTMKTCEQRHAVTKRRAHRSCLPRAAHVFDMLLGHNAQLKRSCRENFSWRCFARCRHSCRDDGGFRGSKEFVGARHAHAFGRGPVLPSKLTTSARAASHRSVDRSALDRLLRRTPFELCG